MGGGKGKDDVRTLNIAKSRNGTAILGGDWWIHFCYNSDPGCWKSYCINRTHWTAAMLGSSYCLHNGQNCARVGSDDEHSGHQVFLVISFFLASNFVAILHHKGNKGTPRMYPGLGNGYRPHSDSFHSSRQLPWFGTTRTLWLCRALWAQPRQQWPTDTGLTEDPDQEIRGLLPIMTQDCKY